MSLRGLVLSAEADRSRVFGDEVEVTPQRIFLALLNLAHQNNSAMMLSGMPGGAERAEGAGGAEGGGVALGRSWLPGGQAWVKLEDRRAGERAGDAGDVIVLLVEQRQQVATGKKGKLRR